MQFNYSIPNTIKIIGEFTSIDGGSSIHWPYENEVVLINPLKNEKTKINTSFADFVWVLINTDAELPDIGLFHKNREKDCARAIETIQKKINIEKLTDLNLEDFRSVEHFLADPLIRKRAYHVISENYRVLEAEKALRNNNLKRLGTFMKATHTSLNTNFEMNFSALNEIVTEANKFEASMGGRLLTDNFFGYTLHLIKKESFDDFKTALSYIMFKEYRRNIEFYKIESSDDISELYSLHQK
jgi:galactokinase